MYAIETEGLTKSFRGLRAVDGLSMHVPEGAVYGFIGENGSGKSTAEKLICGQLVPDSGKIRLFGRDYRDPGVRMRVGALIENAGCFPDSTVQANMMMQAINLGVKNPAEDIGRALKIVRMEDNANLRFSKCSLGMKQRVGIAMALLGDPALLILDEPINGLDADGMRIMREVLEDVTGNLGATVLISSHILGELEKVATHYGIIREGHMLRELSAAEMARRCKKAVSVKTADNALAYRILKERYRDLQPSEGGMEVRGTDDAAEIVALLCAGGCRIREAKGRRVGLEEYYVSLMEGKEA